MASRSGPPLPPSVGNRMMMTDNFGNSNSNSNPNPSIAAETTSKPSDSEEVAAAVAATLLIRHLPEAIPHDALCRLFSHYGASYVRPCTGPRMRNCAFVDFKNQVSASQAQHQLNGLRFLGKVLQVERAINPINSSNQKQSDDQSQKDSTTCLTKGPTGNELSKLDSFPASEPIAQRLGVDYPFPPHLEYAYPPPDGNILTNIVNALIAVPRFYTQVLHLMNKMNIPAPFRPALPTPPLPPSAPAPPPPPPPPPPLVGAGKPLLADLSSDESELESSDEEFKPKRKRSKKDAIVGPAIDKDVAHEAVGLKPAALIPKEMPVIKKKNPLLQIKIAPKQIHGEQQVVDTMEKSEELERAVVDAEPYATPEELDSGKLPPEEILSLPKFKNYTAGDPAPVLYIKNLAKDVIVDDFYFVFGSLFGSIEAASSHLGVKLMQEGRMRGQAFVTFPSTELAHHALNLVNGYVFKGKPMIIQFGRNPSVAKGN